MSRRAPTARPIRAVLFDATGTLIRLRESVGDTYARFARDFGVALPAEHLAAAFRRSIRHMPPMAFPGESPSHTMQLERAWWHDLVVATVRAVDAAAAFADFDTYFNRLFDYYAASQAWDVAPAAHETLAALRQRGLRTGIVSNFDHRLPPLLHGLGLSALLDVVILPSDVGAAKPDPRIFTAALDRLAVPASQAVYVGDDREHDIAGARAAGLGAIDVASLPTLSDLPDRLGDATWEAGTVSQEI